MTLPEAEAFLELLYPKKKTQGSNRRTYVSMRGDWRKWKKHGRS